MSWLHTLSRRLSPLPNRMTRRSKKSEPRRVRPHFELLEARDLFAATLASVGTWTPQGPGPIQYGTVEGMTAQNNPVAGGVESIAVAADGKTVVIGTTAGGVWKTSDVTVANPTWTPLTDQLPSLTIRDVQIHPANPNLIVAGTGRTGDGNRGSAVGVYRTTDGGVTWSVVGGREFTGYPVHTVTLTSDPVRGKAAQDFIGAAVGNRAAGLSNVGGLYESLDGGVTWSKTADVTNVLPDNISPSDLIEVPAGKDVNTSAPYPRMFYVAYPGVGVFKSLDFATWESMGTQGLDLTDNARIRLTAGRTQFFPSGIINHTRVVAGLINEDGELSGLYDASPVSPEWLPRELPRTHEDLLAADGSAGQDGVPDTFVGLHSDGLGLSSFSIVMDPIDTNKLYLGGDSQPTLDSAAGTDDFSGRVFRIFTDTVQVVGNEANLTSPHRNSRDMVFVRAASGLSSDNFILEADEGGIYKLSNPDSNTRKWSSAIGNLQIANINSVGYDHVNNVFFAGTTRDGSVEQSAKNSSTWSSVVSGTKGADPVAAFRDNFGLGDTQAFTVDTLTGHSIRLWVGGDLEDSYRRAFNGSNQQVDINQSVFNDGYDYLAERVFRSGLTWPDYMDSDSFHRPMEVNAADPSRLVVAGHHLYESSNYGRTVTEIPSPDGTSFNDPYTAVAAGVPGQPQVLYAAVGDQVFVRDAGDGRVGDPMDRGFRIDGEQTIIDIAIDPANAKTAYLLTARNVYKVIDGGVGTTNPKYVKITGDLAAQSAQYRSIEIVTTGGGPVLMVGGAGGVYLTTGVSDENPRWEEIGFGLPNGVVTDLHYDKTDNLLYAGTAGRGVWQIAAPAFDGTRGVLSITGTSAADAVTLKMSPDGTRLLVTGSDGTNKDFPVANIGEIRVDLGLGNDTLTIDGSLGVPGRTSRSTTPYITFTDPGGTDTLTFTGLDATISAEKTGTNYRLLSVDGTTTPIVTTNVETLPAVAPQVLATLGHGVTHFLRDIQGLEVTPHVAAELAGFSVLSALNDGTSVVRRILEQGGVRFDELGTTITDLDALEQKLQAASSFGANGASVSEAGGTTTVTFRTVAPLSGQARLQAGQDQGLASVNVVADVTADVELNLSFGVDSQGRFFVGTDSASGAEVTIRNVQGTVTGDGRLGFLGIDITSGKIATDPTAAYEVNFFDAGTSGADGRLVQDEMTKWSSANVNAVSLPGTNPTVPNLSVEATFDVSLFKFPVFDNAKVSFNWNDFNTPGAFTVLPVLDPNNPAQQLIDFITVNGGHVIAAIQSLAGGLQAATGTQVLDTEIPILGKSVGEVMSAVAQPFELPAAAVIATTSDSTAGTFRVDVEALDLGEAGVAVGRTVEYRTGAVTRQGVVEAVTETSFTVRPAAAGTLPAADATFFRVLRPGTIADQVNGFFGNLDFTVPTLQEMIQSLGEKLGIDLISKVTVEETGANSFLKVPLDFAPDPLTFSQDLSFEGSLPLLDLQAGADFALTVTPQFHAALGISLAANKTVGERFFLVKDDANELQLDVSATFTPTATGRIGFLDVTLGKDTNRTGTIAFQSTFGVNVVDPLSPTDKRVTMAELVSNGLAPFSATVSGKLDVDGLAVKAGITNTGDLGQITVSLDGSKADQGGFTSAADFAALPGRLLANIKGAENFVRFDNITGVQVAAALIELIQELGTLSKAPVFTNPLPFINKSPAELLTLAESLVAGLGTPESLDTPGTAATFASASKVQQFLQSKLGVPVGLAVDSQAVRFSFGVEKQQSKTLPFGFALGTGQSFANVTAAGDLTATAKQKLALTLGIATAATDGAGKPILLADRVFLDTEGADATTFDVGATINSGYTVDNATPDPLTFDAAIGPVTLGIDKGRALVRGGFAGTLKDLPGSNDGKLTLGEIGKAFTTGQLNAIFGTTLKGDVQAFIPIDGDTGGVTDPIGPGDALVRIAGRIENFANIDTTTVLPTTAAPNIPIAADKLSGTHVVINTTNLDGLITNGLLSFGNLVEGFEDLLEWGQKVLGINVLDVKIPLVGKSIRDGLNFVEGQPGSIADVLASVRATINSSAAPLTNAAVTTLAGQIATALSKLPNVTALGDVNKSGAIDAGNADFFRVDQSGGKVTGVTFFARYQPTITKDLPFDLALDFLPLTASGAVSASAKLDAYLGFGIDFQNGFFVRTDFSDVPLTAWKTGTPEIGATVTVAANKDLNLSIGGLTFAADFDPNVGTVTGTVGIDLSGGADQRITASEFVQAVGSPTQLAAVSFKLGSRVDVPLKLAAGNDLPSVEGRFFFDIGNGGQVDISAGEKLNPTVAINSVRLNAGSFIDRLTRPLLENLEVFSPFAKVADAFTQPLPLLDRSIYDLVRERLVQNGNSGAVQALDFLVRIGDFITQADALAAQGGGLFIDFGNIPLVGGVAPGASGLTGSQGGFTKPGIGTPGSAAGGPVAVANVSNPDATGSAPGGDPDVAGIPGSGLPVIGQFLTDLGEVGITFPVLKVGNLVKLLTGQTVDLVFVDLPALTVDVGFNSPNIPLFNFGIPYVADVNVAASFKVDLGLTVDLSAGFDTRGLNSPNKNFLNGFYIGDFAPGSNGQIDPTDVDVPEVTLSAGLGIDVNAAVRLLGLEAGSIVGHGGITGNLTVDLNDDNENNYPENPSDHAVPADDTRTPQERKDGKLYLDEITTIRNSRGGNTLALFDIEGKILADLAVTLRALGGLFERSYDFEFVVYEFENVLRPETPSAVEPDLASVAPRTINGVTRSTLVLTRAPGAGTSAADRRNFAASNSDGGDDVQIILLDKNNNPSDGLAVSTLPGGGYTASHQIITTPIPGTSPLQVQSKTRTTVTQPGVNQANRGVKVGQRVSYFSTVISGVNGTFERFATVTAVNGDSFTFEPGTITLDPSKPVTVLSGVETLRVKKGNVVEDFGPNEPGDNDVDINTILAVIVDGGGGAIGSFGAGDDALYVDPFFRGVVSVQGGDGNDTVSGGSGNDSIDGGAGDDVITGGFGNDSLVGGKGDDEVTGGDGDDTLVGDRSVGGNTVAADGEGRDVISGGRGNDRIFGDNTVRTTGANAAVTAGDILTGDEGNDTITAGEGQDVVFGNEGNDRLEGEDGNDSLSGNDGNDSIFGGTGSDDIRGGLGNDHLFTGDTNFNDRNGGIDRVRGNEETGSFTVTVNTSTGIDDDLVNGLDSEFFYYYGGEGRDSILGSAKSDLIFGAVNGNDILGGGGFDRITGSNKNDRIVADFGRIDALSFPADYVAGLPSVGTGGDRIFANGGTDQVQNFNGDIIGNVLSGAATNGTALGVLDLANATAGLTFNLDSKSSQSVQINGVGGSIQNGSSVDAVVGSNFADTFTLQPTSRPRSVNGGAQPAGTKDAVAVNALGAAVVLRPGEIAVAGFQPIGVTNVETYSLTNTSGVVTVVGSAGDDTIRLFATPTGIAYELNGIDVNLGPVTKLTVQGSSGRDRLVLDFADGNPIPAGGLTFAGGTRVGDENVLELRGTGTETVDQTVGTSGQFAGTVSVQNRPVNYSFVNDVVVGSVAKHTLTMNAAFGTVRIGPATDAKRTGTRIESLVFDGKATVPVSHASLYSIPAVTFNGVTPDDFVVAAKAFPTSIPAFTLLTGAGNDTLSVDPAAGDFAWDAGTGTDSFQSQGDVNFTLRDNLVSLGTATEVTLTNAAVETFALTGGDSANTFTLIGFGKDATLDGGAGTDTVTLGLTGGRVFAAEPLTIGGNISTAASATTARIEGSYSLSTSRTVTVADGAAATDLVFDATLSGKNTLTFAGPGTMSLESSLPTTPVNQTGGTLAGIGSVLGINNTAGTIQPGTGTTAGSFAVNGLTATPSTTFALSLHGTSPGKTHDTIGVTGTVNLGGAVFAPSIAGFKSAVGAAYTILSNDGTDPIVGTFAGLADNATFLIGTNQFRISYKGGTGNDVVITHLNTNSAFRERRISPPVAFGELVEVVGIPVDGDALDDFRLTADWGDGTAPESFVFPPGTPEVRLTHQYALPGRYAVALNWVDQHGGGNSDTLVARVDRPHIGVLSPAFADPVVRGDEPIVVRNRDGSERYRLPAFDPAFRGEVAVAVGDVTGDGIDDVVAASGKGGGPRVRVTDGATLKTLDDFFAYEPTFRGGVNVAVGNLDGDRALELATGTGFGGGPRVRTFDLDAGTTVKDDFFAYDLTFRGGVNVAVADTDGNGRGELVTGTGPGGGPHVRLLNPNGSVVREFFAFDPAFRGGVYVGGAEGRIAVGPGAGSPVVKLYEGPNLTERTLILGDPNDTGGVKVNFADVNGDRLPEILVTRADGTTDVYRLTGEEV